MSTKSYILIKILAVALCAAGVSAQTVKEKKENLNFDFTRNPPAKVAKKPAKEGVKKKTDSKSGPIVEISPAKQDPVPQDKTGSRENKFESVALKTREIAKQESLKSLFLVCSHDKADLDHYYRNKAPCLMETERFTELQKIGFEFVGRAPCKTWDERFELVTDVLACTVRPVTPAASMANFFA